MTDKRTLRECGSCTQCCKTMAVTELNKPQNQWCKHCEAGTGCTIFGREERPPSCVNFNCLWKQGLFLEDMRPDKTKVVPGMTKDGKSMVLYVDPSRKDAWRDKKFDFIIDKIILGGGRVHVVIGDKRILLQEHGRDLPDAIKPKPGRDNNDDTAATLVPRG